MADHYGPPPLFGIPPVGDPYRQPSHGRSPAGRFQQRDFPDQAEPQASAAVLAVIFGIPEDHLSAPVRAALDRLIGENAGLLEDVSRRAAREEYLDVQSHRCERTALLNRRGLARELTRMAVHMDQGGLGGTLALFHLDGLERLRRGEGLAAADAACRHAADALSARLRLSDLVAALGGGDFAVFLALTHGEEAEAKAGALAERLNSPPFLWQDRPHPFTIAFGLAEMRPDSTLASLLAAADAALRPADQAMISG